MTLFLELLGVAALILLNAFFVAGEYALVTARRTRIQELADAGNRRARAVQRIVAEKTPSQNSYGTLALILYQTGDIAAGDAAAKKAESLAPKSQRKQVKDQLDQFHKQAVKLKQKQAKVQKNAPPATSPGASPLQSPLGGAGTAP